MIQNTFKSQIKQIQSINDKVQSQLKPQIDKATVEGIKVLTQLGADVSEEKSVSEIIAEIRANNPTLKRLILNLDTATYDARKQLAWNTTMMAAYAKLQAEQKFESAVKPALEGYINTTEQKMKALLEAATELKGKVVN